MESQILIINITQDDIDEKHEMFGLRLIIPEEIQQPNVALGTPAEATVTILDDESKIKRYTKTVSHSSSYSWRFEDKCVHSD